VPEGFVVWFTGLPGSGKTTLAKALLEELESRGLPHVQRLDGDVIRQDLTRDLGFSKEDRDENIRRVSVVASLLAQNGVATLCAFVSPYREARREARARAARFVEVYCRCPLPILVERDPKGLYKKALAGEIRGFTGVDDPYEEPERAEVVCETGEESVEESCAKVLRHLEGRGLIPTAARAASGGLVLPHGGKLVHRIVSGKEAQDARREARGLPKLVLSAYSLSDVVCLATGVYSPLSGFLRERAYRSVVETMRLPDGLVFSLPVVLPVSQEAGAALRPGGEAALVREDGEPFGLIRGVEVFERDPSWEARNVFGTEDPAHPGVGRLLSEPTTLVGGEISVFSPPEPEFPEIALTPKEVRAAIASRGWKTVAAFQTRNPLHRAHEHLLRCALEVCDGLLLSPLMGETKSDDVPAAVRLRTYQAIVGTYLPQERVLIASFPAAMRYAGPREAIFHALCRKNFGATHLIVGRDHAGVGAFYGPREAQEVFERFTAEELGVVPLKFESAFFCTRCQGMASVKTCPHPDEDHVSLSGTKLRATLREGRLPPPEVTRPEVARILMEALK
jgi:sulfate adenylyltransferase/3'-phosphoadenosine 5'-phosphosulfate synthase